MKKSRITKDKILNIIEKHSVFYCDRFSYNSEPTRKLIKKMECSGLIRVAVCKEHSDLLVVLKGRKWQNAKTQVLKTASNSEE
jgi:hypothetical protein